MFHLKLIKYVINLTIVKEVYTLFYRRLKHKTSGKEKYVFYYETSIENN